MSRPRSNSVKTTVEASPLAIQPPAAANLAWSAADERSGEAFGSLHTLKTVHAFPASSRSASPASIREGAEADVDSAANPSFVIDVPPEETHPFADAPSAGRPRSATFGGVPLPDATQSPTSARPSSPTQRDTPLNPSHLSTPPMRPPNRRRSTSNASSISLHLGGGGARWGPQWLQDFRDRRPVVWAGIQAGALFAGSILGLWMLMHALLPPIDDEHRDRLKLPKSFDELQALNEVLQVYKERHWWRVLGCFSTVYLFLQAFSIPGSMYMSILGGALYNYWALPLVCSLVATGALICYFISAALGPALLMNSESWRAKVEAWTDRIASHGDNLIPYLIVLRIAPLPPHWVVNVLAPHLGISIWVFWISTFLGIGGVSYIHVTIGTTLDQMASSDDFHIISIKNGIGLGGIIVAVLVPVLIKRYYKKDIDDAAVAAVADADTLSTGRLSGQYERLPTHTSGQLELLPDSDEEDWNTRRRSLDGPRGASAGGSGSGTEARAKGEGGSLSKMQRLLGVRVQRGAK